MHKVEIKYDADKVARVYSRYFKYGRNKVLRHESVWLSLIVGVILVILGVTLPMEVLIYIGVIDISLVFLWLLYSIIRFRVGINKTLRHYDKYNDGEIRFTFAFDENGFRYRHPEASSEFKWSYVAKHEINGDDAYLFDKAGEHIDIISLDIIGEEQYRRFIHLLSLKSSDRSNN